MREIIEKASKIDFGIDSGDCVIMTSCLTRYMKEKHNTELKVHIGALFRDNEHATLHMWNSYKGKVIDLTAHTQAHNTAQSMILDEPISTEGNAKRLQSYKVDSKVLLDFARSMVVTASEIDPKAITVSHFFLKYTRDGKVPYSKVIESMATESRSRYYEKFLLLMEDETVI